MEEVKLRVWRPDTADKVWQDGALSLSLDPNTTGNQLKQKLQFLVKAQPHMQRLHLVTGTAKEGAFFPSSTLVEDLKTLKSLGVMGAMGKGGGAPDQADLLVEIKVGDEDDPFPASPPLPASVEAALAQAEAIPSQPSLSALRENISRNGDLSYYYAHASPPDVPEEHRVVSGGEPALVRSASPTATRAPARAITQYSWADDGAKVKVYIEEADVLAAATDVNITFSPDNQSLMLEVEGVKETRRLKIGELFAAINPTTSKHRLSAGKRITLTLVKLEAGTTWYALAKAK